MSFLLCTATFITGMSLFVIVNHKTDLLLAMQKTIDGSFPDFSIFVQILKIRKSRKQIILFSYLPKKRTKKNLPKKLGQI